MRYGLTGAEGAHARGGRPRLRRHARAHPPDREQHAEEARGPSRGAAPQGRLINHIVAPRGRSPCRAPRSRCSRSRARSPGSPCRGTRRASPPRTRAREEHGRCRRAGAPGRRRGTRGTRARHADARAPGRRRSGAPGRSGRGRRAGSRGRKRSVVRLRRRIQAGGERGGDSGEPIVLERAIDRPAVALDDIERGAVVPAGARHADAAADPAQRQPSPDPRETPRQRIRAAASNSARTRGEFPRRGDLLRRCSLATTGRPRRTVGDGVVRVRARMSPSRSGTARTGTSSLSSTAACCAFR